MPLASGLNPTHWLGSKTWLGRSTPTGPLPLSHDPPLSLDPLYFLAMAPSPSGGRSGQRRPRPLPWSSAPALPPPSSPIPQLDSPSEYSNRARRGSLTLATLARVTGAVPRLPRLLVYLPVDLELDRAGCVRGWARVAAPLVLFVPQRDV